jgi:SAM-dependent methyltransferase
MDPRETGRGYDQLAEKWQGPHLQKNGIAQFERAIQFSKNHGHALDIGCGSNGRFIDLLLKHGFQPEGVDVSSRMIALATQRHPAILFHEADICEWKFARKYDFISAWDSIWHLPLAQQEPIMKKICGGLAPQGIFIFSAGGLDEPSEHTNSFMGPLMNHSTLGIPKFLELLTKFGCVCRHLEYDQYPEPHIYLIAQKN